VQERDGLHGGGIGGREGMTACAAWMREHGRAHWGASSTHVVRARGLAAPKEAA